METSQTTGKLTLSSGFVDSVPIGTISDRFVVALRAVQDRDLRECPVVLLHPPTGESRILCDSPAGAVPVLLLELLFDCPPTPCARL